VHSGNVAADSHPIALSFVYKWGEPVDRLAYPASDVALGERFGGRGEDRDLLDAYSSGSVKSPLIGHQGGIGDTGSALDFAKDFVGIGQLRDRMGRHERPDFNF